MNNIVRTIYLNRVEPFIGKSLIKVLVGQRRVSKSFLLMQIRDYILRENPETTIIYINKEQNEFASIYNAETLTEYINKNVVIGKSTALFIDEIQDITDFEKSLRDAATKRNIDIYCTGSNANLLSGELATYLSGRYIEFKVFSLCYPEFIQFHELPDSDESFQQYLTLGGMPYLINLSNEELVVNEYLRNIYNSILLKDVVARFNVRDVNFLENLGQYLADNIGSLVSAKKISDYLKSQKLNKSVQSVIDYLGYLTASMLIFKVKRAELKGKKVFEIGEKYYFEDIGLRNALVGLKPSDIGKVMENMVYLHLRIAGYKVNVGSDGNKEIDFIAEKQSERIYVQVAYLLNDDQTINREFGNLLAIPDNYPKFVVTMDPISHSSTYKGIQQVHLRKFCTQLIKE